MNMRLIPLAAAGILLAISGFARAQEGASRIGTCNIEKVMGQMEEKKAFDLEVGTRRERLRNDATRKQVEIKRAQEDIGNLNPESPLAREKNEQLMKMVIEAEFYLRFKNEENSRWEKSRLTEMFDKIREACKDVATEKQIDLVISERTVSPTNSERMTPDDLKNALMQNNVLFAKKGVDLTDLVALKLNARYKNAASGK